MKFDRSLFLLLTGTLAGAACATTSPPQVGPSTAAATSSAPQTLESASPSPSPLPPPLPPPSATPATTSSVADPAPPLPAPPPIDPRNQRPMPPDPGGCGKSRATFDATRTGCDDSKGVELDCDDVSSGHYPASEHSPGPAQYRRRCIVYNNLFKPHVAEAANKCLKGATGKGSDGCKPFSCGHEALMTACPDPSAAAECDSILRACSGVQRTKCMSYLSGLNPSGRGQMVQCLLKCRGFQTCLTGIQ